jgi:hypothetical protein
MTLPRIEAPTPWLMGLLTGVTNLDYDESTTTTLGDGCGDRRTVLRATLL